MTTTLDSRGKERARRAMMASLEAMEERWTPPGIRIRHRNDGALLRIERERRKSGSREVSRSLRVGPNHVHAFVTHIDGGITDLGVSTNLLTNIGRDWWAQQWGFSRAGGNGGPSTATSATSITATATPWTASNLATPQLGLAGLRVYAAPATTTNSPVYGNIVSNTTSVATVDKWWNPDDTTGTTPTATNGFVIAPGGTAAARFIALTTNASAASASDTTLASEITTGGCGRVLGTYAHTYGQATLTLSNSFSPSSTFTNIHKAGCFACLSSAGADPMLYETVLNADATVVNGDTLTLTWTFTLSG